MRPHPDDFNGLKIFQNLINQPVLDIDPAGIGTGQVADKFFVGRGNFAGIFFDDFQESFGLRF